MTATGHGISVSVIAPAAYLREFVAQEPATVHHVTAQRVLGDRGYRDFYREQAEQGAEIVVDNGVFDLGHALDMADLVRAATAVRASEIVLPDVLHDGAATLAATELAARAVRRGPFRFCAVVQGRADGDWLRCYEGLAAADYVDTIALPAAKRPGPPGLLVHDRLLATQRLDREGLVDRARRYRLLGLGRTGHLELREQRRFDWILSVDCATPVILGALGVPMLPAGPFEKVPTPRVETLTSIPADRWPLIRRNIDVVRAAAGCPIRLPVPA